MRSSEENGEFSTLMKIWILENVDFATLDVKGE